MNKPIYLGFLRLEISKTMYGFGYEYIKPKYSDNVRLCYTDTDSFIFHVKTMKILLMILKNGLIHQIMQQH